jgi:AcrR family transcriptional regulator
LKSKPKRAARKSAAPVIDGRYDAGRRRVAAILAAAQTTLVDGGYPQLTLRRVANEAGLPLRHLQYYYPTKEELLRALCETICADYIARCDALSDREHSSPKARFIACVDFLIEDNRDPVSNTLFFELWALACHDRHANRLLATLYAHYRAYISRLIRNMRPSMASDLVELRAVQIVALIEGLTLFIGRNKPRLAAARGVAKDARANILRMATSG